MSVSQMALSLAAEEPLLPSIDELIAANALFVCNHSGGKDSQAMLIYLLERIPRAQLLVVHASLGHVEWPGALEHAERQARIAELPFIVARSESTLLDKVRLRYAQRPDAPSWPSARFRWCTSDLKRTPIRREAGRYARQHGFQIVVNCIGLRADESANRAKQPAFVCETSKDSTDKVRKVRRNTVHTWYRWLPVHAFDESEVFTTIIAAGQCVHYAYRLGNQRLSCIFCIFGSRNDLRNGARHHPQLLREYQDLEDETGYTMHVSMRSSLSELIGEVDSVQPQICQADLTPVCSGRVPRNAAARGRVLRRHASARALARKAAAQALRARKAPQ